MTVITDAGPTLRGAREHGHVMAMKSVNVAELKNRLSHYLRLVRRGEAILVRDRRQIIARIEPAGSADGEEDGDEQWLAALEARGIVRRGRGVIDDALLEGRPRTKGSIVAAVLRERDEGR
jgi:antitoxin (DNA-binding transcriptional repressor) of toxin-antitoxin stability system